MLNQFVNSLGAGVGLFLVIVGIVTVADLLLNPRFVLDHPLASVTLSGLAILLMGFGIVLIVGAAASLV